MIQKLTTLICLIIGIGFTKSEQYEDIDTFRVSREDKSFSETSTQPDDIYNENYSTPRDVTAKRKTPEDTLPIENADLTDILNHFNTSDQTPIPTSTSIITAEENTPKDNAPKDNDDLTNILNSFNISDSNPNPVSRSNYDSTTAVEILSPVDQNPNFDVQNSSLTVLNKDIYQIQNQNTTVQNPNATIQITNPVTQSVEQILLTENENSIVGNLSLIAQNISTDVQNTNIILKSNLTENSKPVVEILDSKLIAQNQNPTVEIKNLQNNYELPINGTGIFDDGFEGDTGLIAVKNKTTLYTERLIDDSYWFDGQRNKNMSQTNLLPQPIQIESPFKPNVESHYSLPHKTSNRRCPSEKPVYIGPYTVPTQYDILISMKEVLEKAFASYRRKAQLFLEDIEKASKSMMLYDTSCLNKTQYHSCIDRVESGTKSMTTSILLSVDSMIRDVGVLYENLTCNIPDPTTIDEPLKLIKLITSEDASMDFAKPGYLRLLYTCFRFCINHPLISVASFHFHENLTQFLQPPPFIYKTEETGPAHPVYKPRYKILGRLVGKSGNGLKHLNADRISYTKT